MHHIYLAHGATRTGHPADACESDRIGWLSLDEILALVSGQITSGTTVTALLYAITGPPPDGQRPVPG